DTNGVWILEHLTLSEEPDLILELRAALSASRIHYVKVSPFEWLTARGGPLSHMTFSEAAETFLDSAGHRGYIDEVVQRSGQNHPSGSTALPLKVRASYLLQARKLSEGA